MSVFDYKYKCKFSTVVVVFTELGNIRTLNFALQSFDSPLVGDVR